MPSTINADNGVVSGSSGVKTTADTSGVLALQSNGSTGLTLDTSLNVGVGTTTPATKLVASGTTTALDSNGLILATVTDAVAANIGGQIMMGGYYTGTTPTAFAGIAGKKENGTAGSFSGYLQFITSTGGSGNTEKARIDSAGNFGIGTTSPYAKIQGYTSSSTLPVGWVYRSTQGSGSAIPTTFGYPYLQIGAGEFASSGTAIQSIGFGYVSANGNFPPAEIGIATTSTSGQTYGDLVFGTRSVTTNTAATERFRIGSSGQFGIGGANYGSSGQVLTSGGSGAAPTWSTPSAGTTMLFAAFSSTGGF